MGAAHKAVLTLAVRKDSRDVAASVNAPGYDGETRVRRIEDGEIPIPVPHKAVLTLAVREDSRDVAASVNAQAFCACRVGRCVVLSFFPIQLFQEACSC